MKRKNILITGAGGFIARNLSIYLKKKGFNVLGIGLNKLNNKLSDETGYKKFINKKISYKNLSRNFKNIDFI